MYMYICTMYIVHSKVYLYFEPRETASRQDTDRIHHGYAHIYILYMYIVHSRATCTMYIVHRTRTFLAHMHYTSGVDPVVVRVHTCYYQGAYLAH